MGMIKYSSLAHFAMCLVTTDALKKVARSVVLNTIQKFKEVKADDEWKEIFTDPDQFK
jgi:hypothetical protein